MSRTTEYKFRYTAAGIRYVLTMLPAGEPGDPAVDAPDVDNTFSDEGDVILDASFGTIEYEDGLPVGFPDRPEHQIDLDLRSLTPTVRAYLSDAGQPAGGTLQTDHVARTFATGNIWRIESDRGGRTLPEGSYHVEFIGVQSAITPRKYEIDHGTLFIRTTILVEHVVSYLLRMLTPGDVAAELIGDTANYDRHYTHTLYDFLVYGNNIVSGQAVRSEFADTLALGEGATILYNGMFRLGDYWRVWWKLANLAYKSLLRNTSAALTVNGNPFDTVQFKKQTYTEAGTPGAVLDIDGIWFPGTVHEDKYAIDGTGHMLFPSQNEYGWLISDQLQFRKFSTLWDALDTELNAMASKAIIQDTGIHTTALMFKPMLDTESAASATQDIVKDFGELIIAKARARGCRAAIDHQQAPNPRRWDYFRQGISIEPDYGFKMTRNNLPRQRTRGNQQYRMHGSKGPWATRDFAEPMVVSIDEMHVSDGMRLYYRELSADQTWLDRDIFVSVHHSVNIDSGVTVYQYAEPITLPSHAWVGFPVTHNLVFDAQRDQVKIMQELSGLGYLMAKSVITALSGAENAEFEIEADISEMPVTVAGRRITLDLEALLDAAGWFPGFTDKWYVTSYEPEQAGGAVKLKLVHYG